MKGATLQYLYPQNLRAEAGMWLWSMRDFTVVAMCVLLAVLVLATTRSPIPLAVAGVYGFLAIRFEEVCMSRDRAPQESCVH